MSAPPSGLVFVGKKGKSRHKWSGRQSAFFDLMCRVIRPVMLLVEDCSPHACKLHLVAIRSNRGNRRKLWITEQRVKIWFGRCRQHPLEAMARGVETTIGMNGMRSFLPTTIAVSDGMRPVVTWHCNHSGMLEVEPRRAAPHSESCARPPPPPLPTENGCCRLLVSAS